MSDKVKNLEDFAKLIKDFKSIYGAGGIQNKSRPDSWRQDLTVFFEKNSKKFINPYADNAKIFNPSIMGYKEDGTPYTLEELQTVDEDKEAVLLKQTEENDMHFIKNSDIVFFYLDGTEGFGTKTEFRENYDTFKKPMIIVRTNAVPRKSIAHWIKWRRYRAIIKEKTAIEFKTLTEMKQFFIDYLGFKEKKEG